MKQGWERKKLGEIILKSETIDPTKQPDKEFVYIDVSSVNNKGFYIENTTTLKGKDAPSRARKLIRINDIIFATVRPTLKRIAIIEEEFDNQICSTGYFVFRPNGSISYKFLFYFLLTNGFNTEMEKLQKGASYPAVTDSEVKNQIISFPKSLPEQQRIVSILDNTFAAIATAKSNAEQNLKNAKELFESYLQSVFENKGEKWEEKKLSEICEMKPQKKEARDKLEETDLVTFLPMEDLGVLNKEIIRVKERQLKDVAGSYTYFADNDVLLAKITPCIENGKIGIARNLINGIGFGSSEYIVFRSKGSVQPEYLYYFLSRNQIREEGKKFMSGAVGHKRVSKDWIECYIIPFPKSLSEQKTIVLKLDALFTETKKTRSHL